MPILLKEKNMIKMCSKREHTVLKTSVSIKKF